MDQLGQGYDEAILSLIEEWDAEDDPSFGATWYVLGEVQIVGTSNGL